MNAFAGIRPMGGQNPTPLAFFPGVCSGDYLFSSGGPTLTTPVNFYPDGSRTSLDPFGSSSFYASAVDWPEA